MDWRLESVNLDFKKLIDFKIEFLFIPTVIYSVSKLSIINI